jgi:hypothetical protein
MKTVTKIIVAAVVTAVVIVGIYAAVGYNQTQSVLVGGLTSDTFSYKNVSSFASSTATVNTLVRGGSGVLGSITIASTSAHAFKVYDGATTATSSATLIASFPASAVVGSYDFNVSFARGLVIETLSGYAGSVVITYK